MRLITVFIMIMFIFSSLVGCNLDNSISDEEKAKLSEKLKFQMSEDRYPLIYSSDNQKLVSVQEEEVEQIRLQLKNLISTLVPVSKVKQPKTYTFKIVNNIPHSMPPEIFQRVDVITLYFRKGDNNLIGAFMDDQFYEFKGNRKDIKELIRLVNSEFK